MVLNAVVPLLAEGRVAMLERIVALSEAMLADARTGNWDTLVRDEPERQRLVWRFFARPLSRAEAEHFEPTLRRVLLMSQDLSRLAAEQRDDLAGQMRKLDQNRRAEGAYLVHAAAAR